MTDAHLTNGHGNVNVQNLKAEKEKLERKCSGEFHLHSKLNPKAIFFINSVMPLWVFLLGQFFVWPICLFVLEKEMNK